MHALPKRFPRVHTTSKGPHAGDMYRANVFVLDHALCSRSSTEPCCRPYCQIKSVINATCSDNILVAATCLPAEEEDVRQRSVNWGLTGLHCRPCWSNLHRDILHCDEFDDSLHQLGGGCGRGSVRAVEDHARILNLLLQQSVKLTSQLLGRTQAHSSHGGTGHK